MQVLTRYLLQKLFGPEVTNMTNNHTILYLDLPSTMVCPLFHLDYFSASCLCFVVCSQRLSLYTSPNNLGQWLL
jgi:hypothetical protein